MRLSRPRPRIPKKKRSPFRGSSLFADRIRQASVVPCWTPFCVVFGGPFLGTESGSESRRQKKGIYSRYRNFVYGFLIHFWFLKAVPWGKATFCYAAGTHYDLQECQRHYLSANQRKHTCMNGTCCASTVPHTRVPQLY